MRREGETVRRVDETRNEEGEGCKDVGQGLERVRLRVLRRQGETEERMGPYCGLPERIVFPSSM